MADALFYNLFHEYGESVRHIVVPFYVLIFIMIPIIVFSAKAGIF